MRSSNGITIVAIWLAVATVLATTSCTSRETSRFPELRGDYLGQALPGPEPQLFAPGLITTGLYTRDVAVTPDGDEIYFSVAVPGASAIMVARREGGIWGEPRVAPFSGVWRDFEPFVAADGRRLLFLSNRPPRGEDPRPGWGHQNIWQVRRQDEGWGEPELLPGPVNTDAPEFYPSLTADGALYFTRGLGDLKAKILRSRWVDGALAEPEELGPQVNAGESQYNAFISPGEDLLLFAAAGRADSRGGSDCYVSFRSPDDRWTGPVNLGDLVNDAGDCDAATLSPDGRFLFFMSSRRDPAQGPDISGLTLTELLGRQMAPGNGSADIYWMDAGFIAELRCTSAAAVAG